MVKVLVVGPKAENRTLSHEVHMRLTEAGVVVKTTDLFRAPGGKKKAFVYCDRESLVTAVEAALSGTVETTVVTEIPFREGVDRLVYYGVIPCGGVMPGW